MPTKAKGWKLHGDATFADAISKITDAQKRFLARPERNAAFVGGMGCCAADTMIAGTPVAEHLGGILPTLHGPQMSSRSFHKGKADLYRVTTQSGKSVVVTLQHRFLSLAGWCPLSSLYVGALIAADGSESAASDWGTASGSLDSCETGSRRCGESLPSPLQVYQGISPLPRKIAVCGSALESYTHLSIADSSSRAGSAIHEAVERHPSHVNDGVSLLPAWDCPPERIYMLPRAADSFHQLGSGMQSPAWAAHGWVDETSSNTSIEDSTDSQAYVHSYWDIVSDIRFVCKGDFYDLTVPVAEHYSAHGLYHHNSGKSVVLCVLAMTNAMRDPNGFSLIGRLNYPALENSTMRIFLELVPEAWGDFQPTAKIFRFINGHEIKFHHLDISDPKVAGPIKSMNLSAAYIDEATELSQDIYLLVDGRVRRKTATYPMVRLASNPAGHDWVWRMYFDVNRKAAWQNYFGINCSMMDNPNLPPEYIANARSAWPDDWQQRYVYGTFADFSDLIYKEFQEHTHVWDSRKQWDVFGGLSDPPADWPVIIGIDIGSDTEHDPWAIVLIAVAPDGRLYQFDEIYGNGLLIANIAEQLFTKLGERNRPDVAYDYAQRQCAMELAECGIVGQPALKEVDPGIFKTAQYIHIDPRLRHPFLNVDGSPRYFVASRCLHTIDELTSYKWAKDRSGNATGKPAHEHSHSPSAVRYAIHTFRPLPEKPKPSEIWENLELSAISREYWRGEARKPKQGNGSAPLLRFQRAKSNLFTRPSFLNSRKGAAR